MSKYKDKLITKISNHTKSQYELIDKKDMRMGIGLFNRACHRNSVQKIKEGASESVWAVIAINSYGFPIVHFINKDSDGKFVDNTLGWEYEYLDYYIVDKVKECDFENIAQLLLDIKDDLISKCGNKFFNKILNIKNDNLGI